MMASTRRRWTFATTVALLVLALGVGRANAQCTLPFALTNGSLSDATQLMANFQAVAKCINPGGSTNAIQTRAANGTLAGVGPLANGQLIIGSTGSAPQAQTLGAGAGIAIANSPGNITVTATSGLPGAGVYRQVMSATPTSSGTGLTTWLNQGSATVSDSAVGICLTAPTSGTSTNLTGRYMAAPTTPYTFTALIAATRMSTSFAGTGIGWYDGSAKLHVISYSINNGALPYLLVNKWNSVTSFSASDYTSNQNAFAQPIWLQISDNGTNVSFRFSQDGYNFVQVFSVAKSSGFLGASGYSNVIFFVDPRGGQSLNTIMSWTQS
jgi:hypothetical protein